MVIEKITITEHKGKNIYKKADFKNRWLYVNLTALQVFLIDKELLERILGKSSSKVIVTPEMQKLKIFNQCCRINPQFYTHS